MSEMRPSESGSTKPNRVQLEDRYYRTVGQQAERLVAQGESVREAIDIAFGLVEPPTELNLDSCLPSQEEIDRISRFIASRRA